MSVTNAEGEWRHLDNSVMPEIFQKYLLKVGDGKMCYSQIGGITKCNLC